MAQEQDEYGAGINAVPANDPRLKPVEVTHHKLTNQTAAQDSLETKANKTDAVIRMVHPAVDNDTRKGSYFSLHLGISYATYFVGLGRNDVNSPWRVITEQVG